MSRQQRSFRPFFLDRFEPRIVPTVTPTNLIPMTPLGQGGLYPGTTHKVNVLYTISQDVIKFSVFSDTSLAGASVTVCAYTSNGNMFGFDTVSNTAKQHNQDNVTMQRLIESSVRYITLDPQGNGSTTIDVSTLKLTGQRNLQVDCYINTASPHQQFPPPNTIVLGGDREYGGPNFIQGWVFNYDTTNVNGKPKR